MEGLETVRHLIRRNDWLVKLDLQDAYLTVPIDPNFHKYLRFECAKINALTTSCLFCSYSSFFQKLISFFYALLSVVKTVPRAEEE